MRELSPLSSDFFFLVQIFQKLKQILLTKIKATFSIRSSQDGPKQIISDHLCPTHQTIPIFTLHLHILLPAPHCITESHGKQNTEAQEAAV